jgi:hypothetical protein
MRKRLNVLKSFSGPRPTLLAELQRFTLLNYAWPDQMFNQSKGILRHQRSPNTLSSDFNSCYYYGTVSGQKYDLSPPQQ